MSEPRSVHDEPPRPDAMAVPDDFWEAPLPSGLTEVPAAGGGGADASEPEPAVDLSLPPFWADEEEFEPVQVADEPARPPEEPDEPAIDVSLVSAGLDAPAVDAFWADHPTHPAVDGGGVEVGLSPRPAPVSPWPEEPVTAEPLASAPATTTGAGVGPRFGSWAGRWSEGGGRAALVALVVGVAALVAFLARPDGRGSDDLVQSADRPPPTVASTVPVPTTTAVPTTEAAAPPTPAPEGGAPTDGGSSPGVARRTGGGSGRAAPSPTAGRATAAPSPVPPPRATDNGGGDGTVLSFVPDPPPVNGGFVSGGEPSPPRANPRPRVQPQPQPQPEPESGPDPTPPVAGPIPVDDPSGVPCHLLPPGRAGCP